MRTRGRRRAGQGGDDEKSAGAAMAVLLTPVPLHAPEDTTSMEVVVDQAGTSTGRIPHRRDFTGISAGSSYKMHLLPPVVVIEEGTRLLLDNSTEGLQAWSGKPLSTLVRVVDTRLLLTDR